jgi:predicted amidohydrolase YtcJ
MMALTNGKIWTGDAARPFARSVVIDGNRIGALDEPAPPGVRVTDLRGRLAVPGFIDNHTHFIDGGMQLSRVQLRDAATPRELARRIGAYAGKAGKGKWITGGGWDHTLWTPASLPTRHLIDAETPDNPVFASRLDIHMALANSAALTLAGITRQTQDPPGGTIVRDADGEPTGILKDAAMALVPIPPATIEERVAAARAALAEAARFGVTSLCDMSGPDADEDLRAYARLELTARVTLFAPILGVRASRPHPPRRH